MPWVCNRFVLDASLAKSSALAIERSPIALKL